MSSPVSKTNKKDTIDDILYKLYKLLNFINMPEINILLLCLFIIIMVLYSFTSNTFKHNLSKLLAYPLLLGLSSIICICVSYVNFPLGLLMICGLAIFLYPYYTTENIEKFENNNDTDNYANDTNDTDNYANDTNNIDTNDIDNTDFNDANNINDANKNKHVMKYKKQIKNTVTDADETVKNDEKYIKNIKNLVTGTITRAKERQEKDLQNLILDNKKMKLEYEQKRNKSDNNKNNNKNNKNNDKNNKNDKNIRQIEQRKFNPAKEDDMNLLTTKEILKDMINRIEYNYEDSKYLKRYLRHRVEEIVETNDLLEDDE